MGEEKQFATVLGPSAEANKQLIEKNEGEIKFLEGIRNYVEKRAKLDLDYADKVGKLHNSIKMDVSTNENDGFLEKVLTTICFL